MIFFYKSLFISFFFCCGYRKKTSNSSSIRFGYEQKYWILNFCLSQEWEKSALNYKCEAFFSFFLLLFAVVLLSAFLSSTNWLYLLFARSGNENSQKSVCENAQRSQRLNGILLEMLKIWLHSDRIVQSSFKPLVQSQYKWTKLITACLWCSISKMNLIYSIFFACL